MLQTVDVAGVENLKLKIIRLLFSVQDARILNDTINLLETEMNVWESHVDSHINEKSIYTVEKSSFVPISNFTQYIKECEASADMTEEEFFSDLETWQ